ncbi:MAG: DUF11 domain-containing protein [Proteobacteria bacterium]|nr:DUF11 domain-containing protein [Pseudomonadota bacterium]
MLKTGPSTATAGGNIAYTITVTNNGSATATNVILDDPSPAQLTYMSAGAPCTGGFPCSLGNLAPGQSVTIPVVTFHIAATASGTLVNTATATSDQTTQVSSSASTLVGQAAAVVPTPIDTRWMLLSMLGLLGVLGMLNLRTHRH